MPVHIIRNWGVLLKRKNSLLEKIYQKNPVNGNYIIELSLDDYADIFNEWDHAPLRRKDIDPDLLRFLDESIDDIPMKNGIDICCYFSEQVRDAEREKQITSWFRTFYAFYIELEQKKIRKMIRKAMVCLLISAVFFISSYLGGRLTGNSMGGYILSEIVVVGGWVFMWEAITFLTFERSEINHLIKNYRRFATAALSFRYK